MGVVLIEQSQQSEALKYFNKALQLDPDHKVRSYGMLNSITYV